LVLNATKGQGIKHCPHVDVDAVSEPHTEASLAQLQTRMRDERRERVLLACPDQQVFQRTTDYYAALVRRGCGHRLQQETLFSEEERAERETLDAYVKHVQRGQVQRTCQGRILFVHTSDGHEIIQ
jgi:hypothetical protein